VPPGGGADGLFVEKREGGRHFANLSKILQREVGII